MLKLVKNMTFDEIVTELNQTLTEIEDKYVESLNIPVYTDEEWDKEKISKTEQLKKAKDELNQKYKTWLGSYNSKGILEDLDKFVDEYHSLEKELSEVESNENELFLYTARPYFYKEKSLISRLINLSLKSGDEFRSDLSSEKKIRLNELESRGLFLANLKNKISKTENNLKTTKAKFELELKQAIDKLEYEKNVAEMRFKCANEGLFEIANDPN
jgi:hypothetical protein